MKIKVKFWEKIGPNRFQINALYFSIQCTLQTKLQCESEKSSDNENCKAWCSQLVRINKTPQQEYLLNMYRFLFPTSNQQFLSKQATYKLYGSNKSGNHNPTFLLHHNGQHIFLIGAYFCSYYCFLLCEPAVTRHSTKMPNKPPVAQSLQPSLIYNFSKASWKS